MKRKSFLHTISISNNQLAKSNSEMSQFTKEEIDKIINSVSTLDYFIDLEHKGKVKFHSKKGKDYFFKSENDTFSVNQRGFFSFTNNEGGQVLKAVMKLENKSWKEAIDLLAEFTNHIKIENIAERRKKFNVQENNTYSEIKIRYSGSPNNEKLLSYFQERGISNEILQAHTKQIHYENNGKKYFGISIQNLSGGYEVRNPLAKIKIGKNDISVITGTKSEIIVFEGMTDKLSFLQLQKFRNQENNRTLVSLNSISNVERFISAYKDFNGKLFLCLDGDKGGDLATNKIIEAFPPNNTKDIRSLYSISENGNNDLNDYLKNKIEIQQKNSKFNQDKNNQDGNFEIKSGTIPDTQQNEKRSAGEINDKPGSQIEPEQESYNGAGQKMGSAYVGNGSAGTGLINSGDSEQRTEGTNTEESENASEQYPLGRRLESSTNISNLDLLIQKYKEQKLTNEQVAEVISAACFISDQKKVAFHPNLVITQDLKNIANQYKSGGVLKEGRGVLDEYYTDSKIVNTIHNLLKDKLSKSKTLNILEPSVGTGNFLGVANQLKTNNFITAFEINETTAKIAKIFSPEADINVRSFESEFIDERGFKTKTLDYKDQYDLVLGNPPYGEHRGFYKGLGEESGISKYEDYFVKRSLDVLKNGGTLAMVLPSTWLNRQKNSSGVEITNAFRLPVGAFAGTQIGTDIIILKKTQEKLVQNLSDYFLKHPDKVLGEIREKTNQFGRLEKYVHGNLNDALERIELIQQKKNYQNIGNLFDENWNTESLESENNKIEIDLSSIKEDIKGEFTQSQIEQKIEEALEALNSIKFKSPAVTREITKYSKIKEQITIQPDTFDKKKRLEILEKAEKLIQNQKDRNSEYLIQSKPEIKKGVLKYQFSKIDEVVNTSLQNSSEITKDEIESFRDTFYDGTLNNHEKHIKYANYIDGKWVHDFYYAEGNIYAKLNQLQKDFANRNHEDGTQVQYEKQKKLLENVLPEEKKIDQIFISPNHEFIHKFDLGQVQKEIYNYATQRHETITVDYSLAEKFKDFLNDLPYDAFQGSSAWEVKEFVDNISVTGSDKERNALVRDRRKVAANDLFGKFVREELSDDLRKRFVKDFNENYNNIHVPDYSKFPLFSKINKNFKGEELTLTEVQKGGIGRQTTKGVGLLAHEVGFGKTLSGVLSMHEAMERGYAKKPLITVPNDSILKQWVETIFETIPNAKVNVLGNLGKDYDLSKFDNKDGEITLVTYEGFNNIGFSHEITEELASKFSYISTNELKSVTNTERETQIELQKEKEIEGKMKRGKIYDWEDFGFDHLTFDEVHNANHIVGKVKIEDRRFASDFRNQNQQTSKIGINTWMAAQYIQDKHDGRNITLLSATPFTNKPLEYYSILSLIANKRLEEKGYFNVNTFFETFMEADNDMEIDAKGDVKFKANVRRFKNNTLFQQLLSEFIDIKGEEDNPELIRPNKINKEYKIDQSDLTKEQYDLLSENFAENEKGAILTHILNARLIAISPYLSPYYDGEFPDTKEFIENSPKLDETMKLIRQNKKDLPEAGQIIYSELAVSEFPRLKEYLVQEIGFKPEEIGIITGATNKNQRISIQNDFNNGKVKVVIGSEAIQEGMNLQMKTTDTYLLSLPYNFTSLRQVEGRSWRQGNENNDVRINFMLTNDSIDVFMLQKLQSKQDRYMEAMKKGADVLDVSDISAQELKTSIITNPETRANIEIEILKKKLESEKSKHLSDSAFVLRKYEDYNKVKELVTRTEESYKRIEGYANNGDMNSDYWKGELKNYQNTIDFHKKQVDEVIENLAAKGVNVAEIKKQIENSEKIITDIEEKIENLPEVRFELVSLYSIENEKMRKNKLNEDIVADRANENKLLFMAEKEMKAFVVNPEALISVSSEKLEYSERKR